MSAHLLMNVMFMKSRNCFPVVQLILVVPGIDAFLFTVPLAFMGEMVLRAGNFWTSTLLVVFSEHL